MENKNIIDISISEIWQHPDNPRKDLGDLTELAESIKKKGIMQNLTVIPGHFEDGEWKSDQYTLIIGHRRCAAAKQAGLISGVEILKRYGFDYTNNEQREVIEGSSELYEKEKQ